jgi:chemotaxis protein CheX
MNGTTVVDCLAATNEDIACIVGNVVAAMFRMSIQEWKAEHRAADTPLSSLIGIAGHWNGAILVECTPGLATQMASEMFAMAPASVTREHIEDVMAELANMIGGNLKALLMPPNTLSLPTVIEGRDYRVRVPGAIPIRELGFSMHQGDLRLLIAQRGARGN